MPEKNPGGRPTKMTPELRDGLLSDISHFVPYEISALSRGISPFTFWEWLRRGFKDMAKGMDTEFSKFSQSVKEVQRERINFNTDRIQRGVKNWQANAWLLERCHWKQFSAKVEAVSLNAELEEIKRNESKGDKPKWKKKKEKNLDLK